MAILHLYIVTGEITPKSKTGFKNTTVPILARLDRLSALVDRNNLASTSSCETTGCKKLSLVKAHAGFVQQLKLKITSDPLERAP